MPRPRTIAIGDRIDPARPMPIYLQIVHAIIHEIEAGRLSPGNYLPSSRDLAAALGVNRKTVVLAYEDLIAQGWLCSSGTRGTSVSDALPVAAAGRIGVTRRAGEQAAYAFQPAPERPLATPEGRWRKLDEGSPDGRLFPAELLARAYRGAVHRTSEGNRLQYRDPRGSPALREALAIMLKSERGLAVGPDGLCITRGSQNGIFLAARTLVTPGSAVLVEELTYEPAVAAFAACGARIVPVKLDEQGIDVVDVERRCREHRVSAIFLTPHHQFPTAVALRPQRRLRLLDLARQFNFAIVEDDYDHEFHFQSQPLLPIASYAPERVIYVGSLSKLMLPALRIGYVVAPPPVIDAIAHNVSLIDGMGNLVTEEAVADLITAGELRRHARKASQVYAARRLAFADAVACSLGDRVDFRMPDGGLAFWLRFRDPAVLDRVEAAAPGLGLRFASSRSYATRPEAPRGLRLGFASLGTMEAAAALQTLGRAAG